MSSSFRAAGALQAQQDFLEKWGAVPTGDADKVTDTVTVVKTVPVVPFRRFGPQVSGAIGGAGVGYTAADLIAPDLGLAEKAVVAGVGALGGGMLMNEISNRLYKEDRLNYIEGLYDGVTAQLDEQD